jgi:ubiquinone/menaquinone biosynthesis C-methylase UbiE
MDMGNDYFMEDMGNHDESVRLEVKTNLEAVKRQAAWAGIGKGMRVLDVCCGIGATTSALLDLVGETGHVTGLDFSEKRLAIARERCPKERTSFVRHDIRTPFVSDQPFDAVWMRFVLEYFRKEQEQIVSNATTSLRPGGVVCLADSDNNSLNHHGQSQRMQSTLEEISKLLTENFNLDPFAGRFLYKHLYDLGFQDIDCMMEPHALLYGNLSESETYNWMRKIEITAKKSGCKFEQYGGDCQAYIDEWQAFIRDPRRFSYTMLVVARGTKPG